MGNLAEAVADLYRERDQLACLVNEMSGDLAQLRERNQELVNDNANKEREIERLKKQPFSVGSAPIWQQLGAAMQPDQVFTGMKTQVRNVGTWEVSLTRDNGYIESDTGHAGRTLSYHGVHDVWPYYTAIINGYGKGFTCQPARSPA